MDLVGSTEVETVLSQYLLVLITQSSDTNNNLKIMYTPELFTFIFPCTIVGSNRSKYIVWTLFFVHTYRNVNVIL